MTVLRRRRIDEIDPETNLLLALDIVPQWIYPIGVFKILFAISVPIIVQKFLFGLAYVKMTLHETLQTKTLHTPNSRLRHRQLITSNRAHLAQHVELTTNSGPASPPTFGPGN